MNKKFDFSAEIESAEARTNREYRERYEEENMDADSSALL